MLFAVALSVGLFARMSRGVHKSIGVSHTFEVTRLTASCETNGASAIGIRFEFGVLGMLGHSYSPWSRFRRGDLLLFSVGRLMGAVCIGTLFLVSL